MVFLNLRRGDVRVLGLNSFSFGLVLAFGAHIKHSGLVVAFSGLFWSFMMFDNLGDVVKTWSKVIDRSRDPTVF